MSKLNLYRIKHETQDKKVWWPEGLRPGFTWQDAIHYWIKSWRKDWDWDGAYQVIEERPSEDGLSGIMKIREDSLPADVETISKVHATIIVEV